MTDAGPEAALLPDLAPCTRDFECASGLCGSGGVCGASDCDNDEACGEEVCVVRDIGRTCEPAGVRGELCFVRTDTPPRGSLDKTCADGLTCEVFGGGFVTEASCVPIDGDRRVREACSAEAPCEPELVCMTVGAELSQCRFLLDAACGDDRECASGDCVDDRCDEPFCDDAEPGFRCRQQACADSTECASNACRAGECS